jgi:AcrR family transcriptional regulator
MTTTATAGASGPETGRRTARERLLDAASELFYAEGVHTVGIDRVIERAGVAKASLYSTFGSKDELVRAYLEERHTLTRDRIERAVAQHDDARGRLVAVFEAQAQRFAIPGYRGCAFVAAAAESAPDSPAVQESEIFRGWLRGLLTELAADAGARDPQRLARQLGMIYDGANLSVRMDHNPEAAADARANVETLLDAALA